MAWMRLAFRRIYGFLRKGHIESEMDEELRFHIHMRTQENIRGGMTPNQARRDAERRFGNFGHIKDLCRDVRGGGMLDNLWQDVRFGVRMLAKNPGFAAVAVLTLGLGIGANTAIFSVVNAVLLRPLPFEHPERVVQVLRNDTRRGRVTRSFSFPNFTDYRAQTGTFEALTAFTDTQAALTGGQA